MLGILLKDNDLVFSTPEGKPLHPNTVTRCLDYAGRPCWCQADTPSRCTSYPRYLMLKQSIHPKIVLERLGHASIQMTLDTYSHVAPGLQQAAAEGFDRLLNHKAKNEAVAKVG